MKKLLSLLLIFVFVFSVSACGADDTSTLDNNSSVVVTASQEDAQSFFDKICENKVLLDKVATNVCSAWKTAEDTPNTTTKDVKDAIEKIKNENSDSINQIDTSDKEITDSFEIAKNYSAKDKIDNIMTSYSKYRDLVLNAGSDIKFGGYNEIMETKRTLDKALRELRSEL